MGPRVPVHRPDRGRQNALVSPPHSFDPGTYGRSFADVYDSWYATAFETDAAVAALVSMAGDGPILELGVGTGRLALPIARAGIRVVGIDASTEMLEHLRIADTDGLVRTTLGDMADVDRALSNFGIDDRFTVVFSAFNTILNLADFDSVVSCLRASRDRLQPDGRIAIEAFVPTDLDLIPRNSLSPARVESDAAVFIETAFDPISQRLRGRHIEVRPGQVTARPWMVLILGPSDLDRAAHEAGLELIDRQCDWSGRPFTDASTAHVSIYRPTG